MFGSKDWNMTWNKLKELLKNPCAKMSAYSHKYTANKLFNFTN